MKLILNGESYKRWLLKNQKWKSVVSRKESDNSEDSSCGSDVGAILREVGKGKTYQAPLNTKGEKLKHTFYARLFKGITVRYALKEYFKEQVMPND